VLIRLYRRFDRIVRLKGHLKKKHDIHMLSDEEAGNLRTLMPSVKVIRSPKALHTPSVRGATRKVSARECKNCLQKLIMGFKNQTSASAIKHAKDQTRLLNDEYFGPILKGVQG
jgi:hypothetical protein